MSSKKSLAARLLTRAFRTRPATPIRKTATQPVGAVGGRIEELEDRTTPGAGDLDVTFGSGGVVTTPFPSYFVSGRGAALQPDGKVVVAGYANAPNTFESALARYNPDGSLDGSFGSGGKVVVNLGGSDGLTAVAVQSDGKIVVAGSSNNGGNASYNFTVARFTNAGVLDTTFGAAATGVVVVPFGNSTSAAALAIQPDGKIVAGGDQYDGVTVNFAVLRFTTGGVLDSTFGTGGSGIVTTDFSASNEQVSAIAIQPDGKIVAAGRTGTANNGAGDLENFALARYTSAGVLDTTFGAAGTGKVVTDFAGKEDEVFGLAIQPDGKIVAVGEATIVGTTKYFGLARYSTGGVLDTTFGPAATGMVTTDFGGLGSFSRAIAIQPDGKLVVGGSTFVGSQIDFALARYTAAGTLDTSFGAAATGRVTTDIGADHNYGFCVVAQPDGKVVVVGQAGLSSPVIALARYLGDPPPPPTYTFTLVADTAGPFSGFGTAALNNSGLVAFAASLDAGPQGIYSGSGGAVNTVVDTTGAFGTINFLLGPGINDNGTVVFNKQYDGIYQRTGAGPITVVSDVSGPAISIANAPSINNSGQVSFFSNLDGSGIAVHRADPNGGSFTLTTILSNGNGFINVSDGSPTPINSSGVVAAEGFRDFNIFGITHLDVVTGTGGPLTTIAQNTSGPLANQNLNQNARSINDAGTVAFVAKYSDGSYGILTGTGGPLATVLDTSGPFNYLANPIINNSGTVAFNARLDTNVFGVWTGPDPVADKVLAQGDALFGSTVTNVFLTSPDGFNDQESLALVADLADGRRVVFRADPVTGPDLSVTLSGGALTLSSLAGARNDNVTVRVSGSNLVITDPTATFATNAGTGGGTNTVSVPLGSVTSIQVAAGGGSDTLTIDLTGGNPIPAGGISFAGGENTGDDDRLVVVGTGTVATARVTHTGREAGSVILGGLGTIVFSEIEPLVLNVPTTDLTIDLPAGPTNTATLADDGGAGDPNLTNDPGTSAVYGGTFEYTQFQNPTNSLTINRGNTADTLAVLDLVTSGMTAGLTIGASGTEFGAVTFGGPVTLASGKNLAAFASGTISLAAGTSDLATSGTGTIALTTARNIALASGSSLTTADGGITLSANSAGSTPGSFVGITVSGATVSTTGSGAISLSGVGGVSTADSNYGVYVTAAGQVSSAGTGTVTITGTGGGAGGTSSSDIGVVFDTTGVAVTSATGNVSVTGQGSTTAPASSNYGIYLINGGTVQSTGSATISLDGTGGGTGGGSTANYGVYILGGTGVTSAGGNVTITGQGGNGGVAGNSFAVSTSSTLTATGTANLTVVGDSIEIQSSAVISAGAAGTVTLRQKTGGTLINVGGADATGSPNTLGLTDAELDRITAGTIQIGNASSGAITVSAAITSNTNLALTTGAGGIISTGGSLGTTGATVTMNTTGPVGTSANRIQIADNTNTAQQRVVVGSTNQPSSVFFDGPGSLTFGSIISAGNVQVTVRTNLVVVSGATISGGATALAADVTAGGVGDNGAGTLTINAGATVLGSSINLRGADVAIDSTASVGDGSTSVAVLKQSVGGREIDLGTNTAGKVGLTDAELDRVTAGTTIIGDSSAGAITVSSAITHANNLLLNSGAGVSGNVPIALAATKNLNITSNGAVSLTGGVDVPGTTTVAAGSTNDIALFGGNNLSKIVITTGKNVALTYPGGVTLGTSTISGTLNVLIANGLLNQTGAVTVAGTATLTTQTAGFNIDLNLVNDFSTVVISSASNASLTDGNSLVLGTSSVNAGSGDLQIGFAGITTGTLTQTGAISGNRLIVFGGGGSTTGTTTLNNSANSFNAASFNTTGDVSYRDTSAITIYNTHITGSLAVTAGGNILSGGSEVQVSVSTTLSAGTADITWGGNNNFNDTILNVTGNNITLNDEANGFVLSGVAVGNLLTLNCADTITQSGGITGNGGVTQQGLFGGGTLVLSQANTYLGTTTILSGTTIELSAVSTNTIPNSATIDVQSGAVLNVTGLTSGTLTLGSGRTLKGRGTVTGKTIAASGSSIAPGASPGILNTGDVTYNAGSNFNVEVNGTTVGTQYDQLNVTGGVTIDGGNLVVALGFTPVNGNTFTVINNDLGDPVTLTNPFKVAGTPIPEGGSFLVGATRFVLTYAGGTNANDVVLTVQNFTTEATLSGGNLVITDIQAGGQNDTLTIKSDTTNSVYVVSDPGRVLGATGIPGATGTGTNTLTIPFGSVTGTLILVNTLAGNDSLTIDFSLGLFAKTVSYDGGTQTTGDSLTLTGGTFATGTFAFTSNTAGTVSLTGNSQISYAGLEPIVTTGATINDVIFTFNGGAETIALTDAAGAAMTIDSTLGESVTFANPSSSLTINAGTGDDTVTVTSVDTALKAALTINGDGNTDTVNLNAALSLGSGVSTGNVDVQAENINVTQAITTTSGTVGTVTLNASATLSTLSAADISSKGVVALTGSTVFNMNNDVTTTGDNVTITGPVNQRAFIAINTAGGNVLYNNTLNDDGMTSDQNLTINAGAGNVTFSAAVGGTRALSNLSVTGNVVTAGAIATATALSVTNAGASGITGIVSGSGTLTKAGSGSLTLSGASIYSGTTTVNAGRLNVNGSVTSNVTVSGGVLGGTGTINSANTLTLNTGFVAPGTSPGILNSGSVAFAGGTFQVEVNGTTGGTQYDQLNVTGTVALGAGTTALSLPTPVIAAGNTYTIVNNDGTDNVTGYFTGLPEGAFVGNFGGTNVYITYAGGTNNNDVQLLTTPTVNGTAGADLMVLRQKAGAPGNYQFSVDNGATFADLGAITTLTVNGLAGNDTLTVDYVNGTAMPAGGVTYDGGTETDNLVVTRSGGAFTATTVTHTFTSTSAGSVDVDGAAVSYTSLESPTTDGLTAANRVFTFNGGAEVVSVTDQTAGDGFNRIASTAALAADFRNPTASLTINAGTGDDTVTVASIDSTYTAAMAIDGQGGADTVNLNAAVTYASGNNLTVTPETISVTAAQNVSGTGTVTLTAGQSVAISANVTGGSGGVSITGSGTAALNTVGVTVSGGAVVTASGSGAVTVNGSGGGGAGGFDYGVYVTGTNSAITSGGGPVQVTGFGGGGSGVVGGSHGVYVEGTNATISSGGAGTVTVQGTGGSGASDGNYGVYLSSSALVTSGGAGMVTVTGVGGSGSGSTDYGVWVVSSAQVTSGGGNVQVTGTGGGSGSGAANFGVYVSTSGTITSGGTGAVTVQGTGGSGSGNNNYGVYVVGTNSQITSSGGAVLVKGTSGGAGSSSSNWGVLVQNGGVITSAGTGSGATVTVEGQGGNTTGSSNHGVVLASTNAQITSSGGAVLVKGTGGGAGSSSGNVGVLVNAGSEITSAGSGATVTVEGQGGNTTGTGNVNIGVVVASTNAQITSSGGAVLVKGTGGGAGSATDNIGVFVNAGGVITSAGTGSGATVTVEGQGGNTTGTGGSNHGVQVVGTNSRITSSGGAVLVKGTGGGAGSSSNNIGVLVQSSGTLSSGAALTVNGTKGVNTTDGIRTAAGTTVTAVGVATLNGLGGSDITTAGTITGGTGGVIASGGATSLSGAVSATNGGIGITTGTSLTTTGSGPLTATGAGGAISTTSQTTLTVGAAVTALGAVQLAFGQDNAGRAAAVNAAVNGSSATVTGGTGNDIVTVAATGATILDVNGGGVPTSPLGVDLVTAVLGGLGAGYVRLNNPVGPTENYRTTVDGTAQATPLTVHANTIADELGTAFPTASGVRRVGVNGATVIDYGPAGATVSVLDLLGGTGADTYFVQFTDTASNALSLLPPLVNVTAADAADAAFVYGTNSPDTVGVNSGNNDRVTSAGVAVRYDGTLEALTVYGKGETGQPGDTFAVRPDQQTAVTIVGGTPLIYPGDTLDLDVLGLVNLNPTLSDPALPDGTFSLTGYGLLSWTGIENFPVPRGLGGSFDFGTATSPVQFGFTPVLPTSSYPAAATEGTGWHGWATTPLYGNQAYNETNLTPALAASPIAALLRDFAYGFQGDASDGVFRVDVAPMKPVQLTALVGIPGGGRDGLVVEWGVANTPTGLPTSWTAITPVGGLFLAAGEMTTVSRILSATDVGNNLSLFVRFRDISGEPHWSVSALDVRPTNPGTATLLPAGLVAPLPVRQEFATDGSVAVPGGYLDQHAFAAVAADGTTIDYYRGKDAIPNSLVTVTVTNGSVVDAAFTAGPGGDTALGSRVLNADAAGYLKSFQVQADAAGEFTFGVRRPTGTATSTVTVADATGFRAGAFTQAFALPTTRRIDFGPTPAVVPQDYGNDGVVGAGYAPFATATYTDVGTNALGWAVGTPLPVAFVPGGTGATAVQRDGVFGGYAPSEFVLDMPGASYVVTATLGDLAARRDDLFVEVLTAGGWVFAKGYNPLTGAYDLDLNGLTSPTGVSPNAGQSLVRTFLAGTVGGQLRVRFGNVTGNPYWSLAALEARPTQAAVSVVLASPTPGGTTATPGANGTDLTEYVVSGVGPDVLPAGTLFTVRPAVGQVTTADADPTTDGVQVAVGADNTARFRVQAPTTAVTNSRIEVEEVTGARQSVATQTYAPASPPPGVPAVRRFDFNGSATAGVTHSSTVGVRGTEVWTPGADYGWLSAVGEFERPTASLPASMTADQKALFRDGATLGGPVGTFRVKVPAAGTNYAVRYYVGDSSKKWPWIRLQVEGGATSGQLATNVNQYWSYVMFGNSGADEYLDIKVFGSATWVLNGIDVAPGTTASALPPSLFAPSPQAAAFTVSSGTAPRLTAAELAPVVAEATRRWAAAGADPAPLAGVVFSVQDLNAVGRLGEHVPGSVHIDDDAGGKGWFVDATPADDAEFGAAVAVGLGATDAAAARGVDLLTVVMHELGHELGLTDVTGTAAPDDVMAESLSAGVRRLPAGLTPAPVVATADKLEPLVRVPVTHTQTAAPVAARPTPALWLGKAETVFAPVAPVADDRVRVAVAAVEPVRVVAAASRAAESAVRATVPAWPDADALLDLDGVYVG